MKSLVLSALFLSGLSAYAEAKREVIFTVATISVVGMECVQRFSNGGYQFTRLELSQFVPIAESKSELVHDVATAQGCKIDEIKEIAQKAQLRFGFLIDVPVTVVLETSESRRAPNGQCLANYSEKIVIDIGRGIVLASKQVVVREVTDCH